VLLKKKNKRLFISLEERKGVSHIQKEGLHKATYTNLSTGC